MMHKIALVAHLLGVIVWVGGMFFAHMALRPAAQQMLEPPQRLPLIKATLDHFFRWVWLAIGLILVSGYWIFIGEFSGKMMGYVHTMQAIGLIMMGLFGHIWFSPYRKMGAALGQQDFPEAGKQMAKIRMFIGINLILGLITTVLGVAKPF